MEKLFELDAGHATIPSCVTVNITTCPQQVCRPMQLRMRAEMARLRIIEVHCGVEQLTLDDDYSAPFPESGFVHVGFAWRCGRYQGGNGLTLCEVGMDFSVCLVNETAEALPFYAEVWGIAGRDDNRTEIAREGWELYAQQIDDVARADERVQEAFVSGFRAGMGESVLRAPTTPTEQQDAEPMGVLIVAT